MGDYDLMSFMTEADFADFGTAFATKTQNGGRCPSRCCVRRDAPAARLGAPHGGATTDVCQPARAGAMAGDRPSWHRCGRAS